MSSVSIFGESLGPVVISGRYALFHSGSPCGEDRWRIEGGAGGSIVSGEQVMHAPHPIPSRQEYRVTLDAGWRVRALEILWTVGERRLHATHAAEGGTWRARIEYEGQAHEQHGDYPDICEVEYATHLFNAFILSRRDFAIGGEHEFPVLRIGPPMMAVSPESMLLRCVEAGSFASPIGPVNAKRYVASLPPRPEDEGYTFWADEDGFVLESYEGLDTTRPWMRLVEFHRGSR